MKAVFFIIVTIVFIMPQSSRAAVYQWTDDGGVVHFTDNADKVPSKYLGRVKERNLTGDVMVIPAVPPEREGNTATKAPVSHDEQKWRSRFDNLREEKKRIETGLAAKREALTTLRRKRAIYQRGSDRAAYNAQNAEIEQDEARIRELDQKLQELDAEAARAGVPERWRQ